VIEPDGSHRWLKPPEGGREGEPVAVDALGETDGCEHPPVAT
jgi:hypothetical protein